MDHSVVEERVKEVILARTGIFVREEERTRLRKAISTRVQRLRLSDPAPYCHLLHRNLTEWDELMPLLTTGETYFLRDQGQCEVLESEILPGLIERNRHRRALRLWSAGCSTGEEAYSLAILVDKLCPTAGSETFGSWAPISTRRRSTRRAAAVTATGRSAC